MTRIAGPVFLLLLLLSASPGCAMADGGGDDAAQAMLDAVNRARADAGRTPLAADARLGCAARRQAADNARRGVLAHTGGDGSDLAQRLAEAGYRYRLAAENLARAGANPGAVVLLWQTSPGHRRNLLLDGAEVAGIARAQAGEQWVWVLVVAAELPHNEGIQQVLSQPRCESG